MANRSRTFLSAHPLAATLAVMAIALLGLAACGGTPQTAPQEAPPTTPSPPPAPSEPPPAAPPAAEPPAAPEPPPEPAALPPAPAPPPVPDPPEPAVSPEQTVTSSDGALDVHVPEGASADPGLAVAVRALGPDELPPELAGIQLRGALYELRPDGATFDEPVTVTRRVDTEAVGLDLSAGVPVITLISRDSNGNWEPLGNQTISLDGTTMVVAGTTSHFSTLVAFGGPTRVWLQARSAKRKVGKTLTADIWIGPPANTTIPIATTITGLERAMGPSDILGPGTLEILGDMQSANAQFTCANPGRDVFSVDVVLNESLEYVSQVAPDITGLDTSRTTVTLTGDARCTAPSDMTGPPAEPDPDDPADGLLDADCDVQIERYGDTTNELSIIFECAVPVASAQAFAPESPHAWIDCFVEDGTCGQHDDGSVWYLYEPTPGGMLLLRNNAGIPSGLGLAGRIFTDGFESGNTIPWSSQVP